MFNYAPPYLSDAIFYDDATVGFWGHFAGEDWPRDRTQRAIEMVRVLFVVETSRRALGRTAARLASEPVGAGLSRPSAEAPQPEGAALAQYTLGRGSELRSGTMDGAGRLLLRWLWQSTTTSSEREMKRVVLNRKNSLFVGNLRGGRTAAILASLTSNCRRLDVDPQLYLTRLLINLPAVQMSELAATSGR